MRAVNLITGFSGKCYPVIFIVNIVFYRGNLLTCLDFWYAVLHTASHCHRSVYLGVILVNFFVPSEALI